VGLDPEEEIGQRHRQHDRARNMKAGNIAAAVAFGAMTLLLPASSASASGPTILPTPLAACPRPEERDPRLTPYCSTV
jgi:hypothetical protein